MFLGFIIGLVIAYLLAFLNLDQVIVLGVRDLIKIDIGHNGYYLALGIMGAISSGMMGGFLSGLVVAYIFTFVNIDHLIIQGVKEWLKYDMSMSAYYLFFAIIGATVSFLDVVRIFLRQLFFIVKRKV